MYQALYRKYRPQTFDDVVGQLAVTQTLKSQLQSGKLGHAYLFTGSRGTGKTSSAKILAKAVNCENPQDGNPCNRCPSCRAIDDGSCMDVLEIDAASNNGVDNVRDLRDGAVYTPSQVKMRVYIIDEVHMLSISAFNALLKLIEEPPAHLLFILATTELHKVPATIVSRCQRFTFRRIGQEDIAARLQYVAYQENIDLDESAAMVLARLADGGMRDGLSLLDQCASATTGTLDADRVYACLGIAGVQQCGKMMACIADKNTAGALELLNQFYAEGKDMAALMDEMMCLARDLMILKTAPKEGIAMLSGVATHREVQELEKKLSTGELVRIMNELQKTAAGFTKSTSRRMDAELCIVNLCRPELTLDGEALNARLTKLEQQLRSGHIAFAPQPKAEPAEEPEEPKAPEKPEEPEKLQNDAPEDFWPELVRELRTQLSPAICGFFVATENAPVTGVLQGNRLTLLCVNGFTKDMIGKQQTLNLVAEKASQILGRQVAVSAEDRSARPVQSQGMEQLLQFGREHADIIRIKKE